MGKALVTSGNRLTANMSIEELKRWIDEVVDE